MLTFLLNIPSQITGARSSANPVSVNDVGDSRRTAFNARTEERLKWVVMTRFLIKLAALSEGTFLINAPKSFALVIDIASSASLLSVSMSPRTAVLDASLIFAPALLMTSYNAFNMAFLTPGSVVLDPVTNSAISGSILGVKVINVPRALAALDLSTSLDGSANDFAKVR